MVEPCNGRTISAAVIVGRRRWSRGDARQNAADPFKWAFVSAKEVHFPWK